MNGPDIMNARQAAEYLGVAERTLLKWAREGRVPGTKIGRVWRFSRDILKEWVEAGTIVVKTRGVVKRKAKRKVKPGEFLTEDDLE